MKKGQLEAELNAARQRVSELELRLGKAENSWRAIERLDLATSAARMGIWDWDIQKNELVWDEQMYRLYGLEPGEFGGAYEAWLHGVYPDDREPSNDVSAQAVRGEREYDTEFRVLWPDGSVHWLKANGQVFRDEHGTPLRMVGVNYEITERKRAEEELRASKKLLQDVIDNTATLVYILDLEGRFLLVNHRTETIFGLPNAQIVGQTRNAFLPTEFAAQHRSNDLEIFQTGQGKLFEEENLEPDGRHVYLTNKFPLFDTQNQVFAVCGISTDMTERKRMEEELRRSNAELEQFAYVASHDLQEPLRAMAGMVQLLQQRYKGQLDERADEYIRHAVEAASRMQSLINDLLTYSRIDRHGKTLEPVSTQQALDFALANLQVSIHEMGAEISHDELPSVLADTTQLTQLFQNLISNAIKFRGERTPKIRIEVTNLTGFHQFSVCDNGIGIEAQYFERIFLVFQRLHTRREYPGTGIGLALCKKIVERHGGQLWVESVPGEGSKFHFTLPKVMGKINSTQS